MTTIVVYNRPIHKGDYEEVENLKLRKYDEQELLAACPGMTIPEILAQSARKPTTEVGVVNGVIEGVGGCPPHPLDNRYGICWCVGTNVVYDHIDYLTGLVLGRIEEWLRNYRVIGNCVDARNTPAIKWLKKIGFKFDKEPAPFNGHPFYHFWKVSDV